MLAIGDALPLVLMEKKRFTRQYGLRHHGGYLGQKARQTAISELQDASGTGRHNYLSKDNK